MTTAKKERPRHLGRGLESLLGPIKTDFTDIVEVGGQVADSGNFPVDKMLRQSLLQIELDQIAPNPHQPRTEWDPQELDGLAESIKRNGVLQPVIVRGDGHGYQLIAGERRLRAARLAGKTVIPAIVRQTSDREMLELALVENIHRSDLNPVERGKAYQKYLAAFGLTQAEAAERLGEDRSVIANYIRLLDLPEEIRQMLVDQQISMGHARAILAIPSDELRRKLANRALAGRLSVRQVERLVRQYVQPGGNPRKAASRFPHIIELETKLAKHLGTAVSISTRPGGRTGRITIEFRSLDEFDRISERIGLEVLEV